MEYFLFKEKPQDFIVEEKLYNYPTWRWRYLYVYFEKKNKNTYDIIYDLKEKLWIDRKHLWIAWIKDKHWITRQWISIETRLFKKGLTKEDFLHVIWKNARILKISNDENFLRMWDNKWNTFFLRLRQKGRYKWEEFQKIVSEAIDTIKSHWFPNYFGAQRFWNYWDNWQIWQEIIEGTYDVKQLWKNYQTEMIFKIQAFASHIFNQYILERMKKDIYNKYVEWDILMDLDTKETFIFDKDFDIWNRKLAITGPMIWNDLMLSWKYEIKNWKTIINKNSANESFNMEIELFKRYWIELHMLPEFQRFSMFGLRRPIKMYLNDLRYKFDKNGDLLIMFDLSSWCYASIVIEYLEFLIEDLLEKNKINF